MLSNTLSWTTKASACQTMANSATVTLIALLILYAHIRVKCCTHVPVSSAFYLFSGGGSHISLAGNDILQSDTIFHREIKQELSRYIIRYIIWGKILVNTADTSRYLSIIVCITFAQYCICIISEPFHHDYHDSVLKFTIKLQHFCSCCEYLLWFYNIRSWQCNLKNSYFLIILHGLNRIIQTLILNWK